MAAAACDDSVQLTWLASGESGVPGPPECARIDGNVPESPGITGLIQHLLGVVLFHGLVPHFHRMGDRLHSMSVVGSAPQARLPIKGPGITARTPHISIPSECYAEPIESGDRARWAEIVRSTQ